MSNARNANLHQTIVQTTERKPIHEPERLNRVMDEKGLDALIASSFRHTFYLSGFYVDPAGMGDDSEVTCALSTPTEAIP